MGDQQALPFSEVAPTRKLEADSGLAESIDALAEPDDFVEAPVAPDSALGIRIVRSKRRKKSVGAQIVNGIVEVVVPTWMSKVDAERHAEQMRIRFERKRGKSHLDLLSRARSLARTYDFPQPESVRWVTNQNNRWGSCTPVDGSIRLSHRLRKTPQWVLDYVLVHELCHLRHLDHSPAFWAEVNRYPKTERARGFLIGLTYAEISEETDY